VSSSQGELWQRPWRASSGGAAVRPDELGGEERDAERLKMTLTCGCHMSVVERVEGDFGLFTSRSQLARVSWCAT
jgi:hypothetical protein